MWKNTALGTFIVVINVILGRAIVGVINQFGIYPEKWLAQKMYELSVPFFNSSDSVWLIAGILAVILFYIELQFGLIKKIFDMPANKSDGNQDELDFNLVCEQDRLEKEIRQLELMNPQTPTELASKKQQLSELQNQLSEINRQLEE